MPKPRIRLKLSDIDLRKVSDGEESVADIRDKKESIPDNILVKIKDEATATREGIDKLNDVMTRLADAFAASLALEKKEINRQVKKDQREKTAGDIADDVKKKEKKKSADVGGAIMRGATNPFGVLTEAFQSPVTGILAAVIGLGLYVKNSIENWANNVKKAREEERAKYKADMAKERAIVDKSITDGKTQIQEATKGYEEALKAGNTELAKKYKESIQSVKDEWSANLNRVKKRHAEEVLRLQADISSANKLGVGAPAAAAVDQAKALMGASELDLGNEFSKNFGMSNNEKIVQSDYIFKALNAWQKGDMEGLRTNIEDAMMMEKDYGNLDQSGKIAAINKRVEEYIGTTGKKGGEKFMVAVGKASKELTRNTGEYGPSGMDQFMGRQQKKEGQIRLAKQRKARAVNVRQESIGKTAKLNDHKNVHGMGVMEYQSGTAVRVDDFGSRPEGSWFEGMSEGLKEAVTSSINEGISTVSNAWDGVVSWFQSEESKKEEESRLKKENTEYMKKVSEDIDVLNKFFTEGNNITIVKGGDSITVNGGTTLLNNSQLMTNSGSASLTVPNAR